MISKISQALFMMTIVGLATIGSPPSAEAGDFPARFGISDYPTRELNCWQPYGVSVTNICGTEKNWGMPLISAANLFSFTVTVTAQAASNSSNVRCRAVTANASGGLVFVGQYVSLSQFGAAQSLLLSNVSLPWGGAGMIDCWANPGGKIHTMTW